MYNDNLINSDPQLVEDYSRWMEQAATEVEMKELASELHVKSPKGTTDPKEEDIKDLPF